MWPEARILLGPPMLVVGLILVVLVAIVLALFRDWWRVLAGVGGAVCGYVLLGTKFAYQLADSAIQRGRCPDAGWFGPAKGALVGAIAALIVRAGIRQLRQRRAALGSRGVE
jgi:uncharacterized membrane protein